MNRKQFLRRSALLSLAAAGLPRIANAFQTSAPEKEHYKSEPIAQGDGRTLEYAIVFPDKGAVVTKSATPLKLTMSVEANASGVAAKSCYYDIERTGDPKVEGEYTIVKFKATGATRGEDVLKGGFPKKLTLKIKPGEIVVLSYGKAKDIEMTYFEPSSDDADADCFLTTACTAARGLPDDCSELMTLRCLRDEFMKPTGEGADMIAEYYHIAPPIVRSVNARLNRAEIWNLVYDDLVTPSLKLIQAGKKGEAVAHYSEYVKWMKEAFL